ncbi:hypothetical protein ACFWZ3_02625 [Frateuria sp. GZRR35]|uniref:hypothetical protein n=1 Tax=Frateuria sp. GZRR35 TaxID=3351536 RepID=UPI003EDC5C1C
MSNTIKLLETISANAALRYASMTQLAGALEGANASSAFKRAACSGNGSALLEDFGTKMHLVQASPQVIQMVWREALAAA